MFNVECCKPHEILLPNHRNYGMVVIVLSFLCNYDNLTLKLHQGKRSYLDEGWIFIGRFKVGSVPGMNVFREVKSIVLWFLALVCLYLMQARVDWVLIIFGTQVIKKKRPVRPVLPDYLSVSYDYDKSNTLKNSQFLVIQA